MHRDRLNKYNLYSYIFFMFSRNVLIGCSLGSLSHCEFHDGIDDVILVALKGSDGLLPRHTGL